MNDEKLDKGATNSKIQSYPVVNLHPMAGMKNIVRVDGTERKFKLSDKAQARHDAEKRSKKNYVAPMIPQRQRDKYYKKMKRQNPHYPYFCASQVGKTCDCPAKVEP